jgi:hypothetical protein
VRQGSLRAQIDRAIDCHVPERYKDLAEQTSSSPGKSAVLLRRLFYGLMGVTEPRDHAALLAPLPLPSYEPARPTSPVRVLTTVANGDVPEVMLIRYPHAGGEPDPAENAAGQPQGAHTSVDEETRDTSRLHIADIVVRRAAEDDPRVGPPAVWTSEALTRYPHCGLVAYVDGLDRCVVRTRAGQLLRLTAAAGPDGRPDLCDPAAYASALYAWIAGGRSLHRCVPELTVQTGPVAHRVTMECLASAPFRDGAQTPSSESLVRTLLKPTLSPPFS